MNLDKTYAILFAVIAILYFSTAYGIKLSDKRKQQALGRVKVNSDNSVKTPHRTYKSAKGYFDFCFYDDIVAGSLATIVAVLSYVSAFFDFIGPAGAIIIYVAINFFLYSKFKEEC